jgi:hypothetical protein
VTALAYPNGGRDDYTPQVVEQSARAGYAMAFAVDDRFHTPGTSSYAISRIAVPGHLPASVSAYYYSGVRDIWRRT